MCNGKYIFKGELFLSVVEYFKFCKLVTEFDSPFIHDVSSFSYDCAFLFYCSIRLWSVIYWSHILLPEWVLMFEITYCKFCTCVSDMNPSDWKSWVNGPFFTEWFLKPALYHCRIFVISCTITIESKIELSLLCFPWKVGLLSNGVSAVIVVCSLPSL